MAGLGLGSPETSPVIGIASLELERGHEHAGQAGASGGRLPIGRLSSSRWQKMATSFPTLVTTDDATLRAFHAASASARFDALMVLRSVARYLAEHELRG